MRFPNEGRGVENGPTAVFKLANSQTLLTLAGESLSTSVAIEVSPTGNSDWEPVRLKDGEAIVLREGYNQQVITSDADNYYRFIVTGYSDQAVLRASRFAF